MAANEIVGVSLQADGSGALQTVGSFRKQLRDATEDLNKMSAEFGTTSTQAQAAAKRVAELRDTISDARSLTEAFNPDKKFTAFAQSLQGVVGGFAAAQGAMALFGVESEEVEKTLLKVQAALALSQGLNTVLDSIQAFKNLGAVLSNLSIIQKANAAANSLAASTMKLFGVSVETTAVSFRVLKTAIISTGIGVFVVLLGEAIAAMQSLGNAAEDAAAKQKELNQSLLDSAQAGRAAELAFISTQEKLALAKAKAEGKSEEELTQIQLSFQRLRIGSQKRYHQEAGELDEKSKADLATAEADYRVLQYNQQEKARQDSERRQKEADAKAKSARDKALADRQQSLQQALEAEITTREEINKLTQTEEEREQYDLSLKYAERIKAYDKIGKDTTALIEAYEAQSLAIYDKYRTEEAKKREEDFQKQLERDEAEFQTQMERSNVEAEFFRGGLDSVLEMEGMTFDQRREMLARFQEDLLLNTRLTEEEQTRLAGQFADARIEIDKREAQSKRQVLATVAGALNSFSDLLGENTAAGKALAIAATTIQTFQSAQAAFTGMVQAIPGPVGIAAGVVAAAGAVAAGIANVRKIVAVKVPKSRGGGSAPGGAAAPSISAAGGVPNVASNNNVPINPQVQQQQTTLSQQSVEQLNGRPVRAYVVESEVTGTQNRIRNLENAATIF